ncbi:MAG: xanthine dehydrogenase family protein molybdopterin-binding subunit, partial [Solirubrobacterales bacterium]
MLVGERVPRLEDDRLLRGRGRFVDDVDVPNQLHMHVVRSDEAHARIGGIDTSAAKTVRGVRGIFAAADLDGNPAIPLRLDFGVQLDPHLQHALAGDRVRYVGEPVAVVVAETAYAAEDAAWQVAIDYEPLPVVLDPIAALAPDAPSLWDEGNNEAAELRKEFGDIDAAFAAADQVVSAELRIGRHTGVPLETRGLVAVGRHQERNYDDDDHR